MREALNERQAKHFSFEFFGEKSMNEFSKQNNIFVLITSAVDKHHAYYKCITCFTEKSTREMI